MFSEVLLGLFEVSSFPPVLASRAHFLSVEDFLEGHAGGIVQIVASEDFFLSVLAKGSAQTPEP